MVSKPIVIIVCATILLFGTIFIWLATSPPVEVADNLKSPKIQEEKNPSQQESGRPLADHTFASLGNEKKRESKLKTSGQSLNSPAKMESKHHAESERDRIFEQVRDAAITYDPASLSFIAPYLNSPDLELREAAVNAVVTLGDAAGAPLLRSQASKETDQLRKKELLDLAAWLELPPAQIVLPKKKPSPTPAQR
jgi:hypothetical protein